MTSERLQILLNFFVFRFRWTERLGFEICRCRLSFFVLLDKDQHHRKQSSVGGMRLLRLAIVHTAFGESRVEVTDKLLDMRELFMEVIEPKMRNSKGEKEKEKLAKKCRAKVRQVLKLSFVETDGDKNNIFRSNMREALTLNENKL